MAEEEVAVGEVVDVGVVGVGVMGGGVDEVSLASLILGPIEYRTSFISDFGIHFFLNIPGGGRGGFGRGSPMGRGGRGPSVGRGGGRGFVGRGRGRF